MTSLADNGSTDATAAVVRSLSGELPVRWVEASGPASASHARNVGASAAEGRILAFCDADDETSPGWVDAHRRAVEQSGGAISGGLLNHTRHNDADVLFAYGIDPSTDPPFDPPADEPVVRESTSGFAGYLPTVAGGNFAMLRQDYFAVGGMDPSYPGGAEETDFAWRAQEAGHRVVMCGRAMVAYDLQTTMRGPLRQQRIQQRARILLWIRHRGRGMNGPSLKASLPAVAHLVLTAPVRLRTRAQRLRWAYLLRAHIGALEGMVQYRLFPRRTTL
ncbi:glycosyltransferase family 2 protein [Helcobacillus massiliensis]|uniref:glycosyltransferase family 2 protein n=1 Tax=Helcobacillus massiliensis TaxID=521392 RepID=UPI0021A48A50|nr:glycosyltransferase family A protein [Helcobacillus massiliensis]MCT2035587.1 glycosyltransferase family 2 protein [Helcobacillus massiliensis]